MRTPINSSSRNIIMGGNCQVDDYPSPTSHYASFSSGCPDGNTILNGRDCFQICVDGGEILLRHLGVHGPGHDAVKFTWRHGLFQVGGVGVLFKARYKIFPRPGSDAATGVGSNVGGTNDGTIREREFPAACKFPSFDNATLANRGVAFHSTACSVDVYAI